MPGQGRLGDKAKVGMDTHGCPACPHPGIGPGIQGSPDVNVNKRPALRVDDLGIHAACCGANTWTATKGSATVFINGKAAHRMGDQNRHCGGMGQLVEGSPNVMVGDAGGAAVTVRAQAQAASTEAISVAATTGAGSRIPRIDERRAGATTTVPLAAPIQTEPAGIGARSPSPRARLSFLEIKLVDTNGRPVPGARYQVTSVDGAIVTGVLDASGLARVNGLPEGSCEVTFPDLHGEDWGPQ